MKRHRKHKNVAQKTMRADKRRQAKKATHQAERRLARKLYHIAEQINKGHFEGVKTSPLLACNLGRVRRYLNKGPDMNLLDMLNFG